MHTVFPVAAGLAAGIALLFFVSTLFQPGNEYRPRWGFHAEEAVKIASEDSTLQGLIGSNEVGIRSSRDVGVAGPNCPINWCAIVLVEDKLDPKMLLYGANVNIQEGKVVGIYIGRDFLIAQTKENVDEVRAFFSRFPDAEADVQFNPGNRAAVFTVYKTYIGPDVQDPGTKTLSVIVETTTAGQVTSVYAQCDNEKVTSNVVEFIKTTDCLEP